jgi:hypothetical protein
MPYAGSCGELRQRWQRGYAAAAPPHACSCHYRSPPASYSIYIIHTGPLHACLLYDIKTSTVVLSFTSSQCLLLHYINCCPHTSLQAKLAGAVEVPLFVEDTDMSPATLLKQVGSKLCLAGGSFGRLRESCLLAIQLPLIVWQLCCTQHTFSGARASHCPLPLPFVTIPCSCLPAPGLQLWHGRLVAGRLPHEAQPAVPGGGAGEEGACSLTLT